MKKFVKYAPLACSFMWLILFVLAIIYSNEYYRIMFICAAATLTIVNLAWFIKEYSDDRETERSDNEPGRESELDDNFTGGC